MKLSLFLLILSISSTISNPLFQNLPLKIFQIVATQFLNNPNLSKECGRDLKTLISESLALKFWTIKMLDATAKPPPGLLEGNIHLLGDYDLCLGINEKIGERNIEGQYCTALVVLKNNIVDSIMSDFKINDFIKNIDRMDINILELDTRNITIPWGFCIPKTCQVQDLNFLGQVAETKFKLPAQVSFYQDLCLSKDKPVEIDSLDKFAYTFFICMIAVVVLSTLYDLTLRFYDRDLNIFTIFSLYSNWIKFFWPAPSNSPLNCINGIKVLSCSWIFLAHLICVCIFYAKNLLYITTELKNEVQSTFFYASVYSVDTFLAITGLLTTTTYLKTLEKMKINLFSFYLVRLVRMFPAVLATVFLQTSVLKLLVDGPYGQPMVKAVHFHCPQTWWRSLLFINNWFGYTKQCPSHLWYTAVDMQLYILAPLFLFTLKRSSRRFLAAVALTFVIGISYSYIITVVKKLGFLIIETNADYVHYIYFSVLHHMPCWLIGALCGYLLYYHPIKMHRNVNVFFWMVALYSIYKLIVNQLIFVNSEYNVTRAALWNSFARPLWCASICFIIYSCANGSGGMINTFLSHSSFRILSKLTFCIYLIHPFTLFLLYAPTRESIYFENYQILSRFTGGYIITIMMAVILYLGFEAPIAAIKDFYTVETKSKEEISKLT